MSPEGGRGWPSEFVRSARDRDALLVLSHLDGPTPRELNELAWEVRSARACLEAVLRGSVGSANDREIARSIDPVEVRAAVGRCGARHVIPGEEDYPTGLLDLPDPPAGLFLVGPSPPILPPAVSVVGARRCSPYGEEVAESIGRGLAAAGVTVVSGAARGIDGASHRGALAADGSTVAVLGSGIDVPYPRAHRRLLGEIAAAGAIISEYPPGMQPLPRRFPARNRIVAALTQAVVVVEGAPGSGSMITAEFALDLGRDVFAVPGPVTNPLSAVPNALIREGAGLIRGPEDVLESLEIDRAFGPEPSDAVLGLTLAERAAFDHVTGAGVPAEVVAREAGIDLARALSILASLELRGLVRRTGGRYQRVLAGNLRT